MTRDRMAGGWKRCSGAMREVRGRLMAEEAIQRRSRLSRRLGRILQRHGVAPVALRHLPLRCAHA
jgi:hypothetical protein